ncbi:hypothetical protein GcM1_c11448o2 [Golovinomyces cichoracearum]|uniref:Uncharacterized protein n=1 Tax=Golovinomyces cichoracearum TaxID=62708 RepID=A0A420IEV4_9PEZI|nr:hypothetical protein GcM1_c11448o2 [Golovinomyces cichoracearum]
MRSFSVWRLAIGVTFGMMVNSTYAGGGGRKEESNMYLSTFYTRQELNFKNLDCKNLDNATRCLYFFTHIFGYYTVKYIEKYLTGSQSVVVEIINKVAVLPVSELMVPLAVGGWLSGLLYVFS